MILQGENKAEYIAAEGELSALLSNFSTDFIYNSIEDLIEERNTQFTLYPKSNFVSALEKSFKSMVLAFPSDKANIMYVRDRTYQEIIQHISDGCKVTFTYDLSNVDICALAKYIYDLFIARYDIYVFTFLRRFLVQQKDYIYNTLQLEAKKKAKDTTTIYNRTKFDDPKLAVILANLGECINLISSLDFDPYQVLSYIYYTDEEQNIMYFLLNYIDPNSDLFEVLIGNVLRNPMLYNPCFAHLKLLGNIQEIKNDGIYSPEF